MAQLVEHIVHIDGVTGSSPVATTISLTSLLVRLFLTLPQYSKGCEPHGEIRLPREAQQEGAEGIGQPETCDMDFLPHDQEGRKQKALQP